MAYRDVTTTHGGTSVRGTSIVLRSRDYPPRVEKGLRSEVWRDSPDVPSVTRTRRPLSLHIRTESLGRLWRRLYVCSFRFVLTEVLLCLCLVSLFVGGGNSSTRRPSSENTGVGDWTSPFRPPLLVSFSFLFVQDLDCSSDLKWLHRFVPCVVSPPVPILGSGTTVHFSYLR